MKRHQEGLRQCAVWRDTTIPITCDILEYETGSGRHQWSLYTKRYNNEGNLHTSAKGVKKSNEVQYGFLLSYLTVSWKPAGDEKLSSNMSPRLNGDVTSKRNIATVYYETGNYTIALMLGKISDDFLIGGDILTINEFVKNLTNRFKVCKAIIDS